MYLYLQISSHLKSSEGITNIESKPIYQLRIWLRYPSPVSKNALACTFYTRRRKSKKEERKAFCKLIILYLLFIVLSYQYAYVFPNSNGKVYVQYSTSQYNCLQFYKCQYRRLFSTHLWFIVDCLEFGTQNHFTFVLYSGKEY